MWWYHSCQNDGHRSEKLRIDRRGSEDEKHLCPGDLAAVTWLQSVSVTIFSKLPCKQQGRQTHGGPAPCTCMYVWAARWVEHSRHESVLLRSPPLGRLTNRGLQPFPPCTHHHVCMETGLLMPMAAWHACQGRPVPASSGHLGFGLQLGLPEAFWELCSFYLVRSFLLFSPQMSSCIRVLRLSLPSTPPLFICYRHFLIKPLYI